MAASKMIVAMVATGVFLSAPCVQGQQQNKVLATFVKGSKTTYKCELNH